LDAIAQGAPFYLQPDALGSVRGVTNGSGVLSGTADYDVYGAVRASSGTSSSLGYTGQQTDAETGFSYLRARYLSPATGRFLSADTVQPSAPGTQGYNGYDYAGNAPTTWADPSGHLTLVLAGTISLQVDAAFIEANQGALTLTAILGTQAIAAALVASEAAVAATPNTVFKPIPVFAAAVFLMVTCYLDYGCWHAVPDGSFTSLGPPTFHFPIPTSPSCPTGPTADPNFGFVRAACVLIATGGNPPRIVRPWNQNGKFWRGLKPDKGPCKHDDDGNIYKRDYTHGELEKWKKNGEHLGSVDPETGDPIPNKGPQPNHNGIPRECRWWRGTARAGHCSGAGQQRTDCRRGRPVAGCCGDQARTWVLVEAARTI
jgi:RHS repeat-associated protein